MAPDDYLNLITIVIQRKDEKKTIEAATQAGAPGITYFYGRGTGVRERLGSVGEAIEPDKVVLVTAVPPHKTQPVVQAVMEAANLRKLGNGFLSVQKLDWVVGLL